MAKFDYIASKKLTPQEVSEAFGVSTQTLCLWRKKGQGPAFLSIGRHVAYLESDLQAWASRCHNTTAGRRQEK